MKKIKFNNPYNIFLYDNPLELVFPSNYGLS